MCVPLLPLLRLWLHKRRKITFEFKWKGNNKQKFLTVDVSNLYGITQQEMKLIMREQVPQCLKEVLQMLLRDLTAVLLRFITFTQAAFRKLLMHSWSHYADTNFKVQIWAFFSYYFTSIASFIERSESPKLIKAYLRHIIWVR